jgi:hypothetical protein
MTTKTHRAFKIATLIASPIALIACQALRYPSLGIDGIESGNAPYVAQRMMFVQEELETLAKDAWFESLHAVLTGAQPECGVATYDGPEGTLAADATVTIQHQDCESGVPLGYLSATFRGVDADAEPTPEAFAAKVHFIGLRGAHHAFDAQFNLSVRTDGGTDPLAVDHAGASWRLDSDGEGGFAIASLDGKKITLQNLGCHFGELRDSIALDTSRCNFTLLDGSTENPLEVYTPKSFKMRVDQSTARPYEGVMQVRDIDDTEVLVDIGAVPEDSMLLRTRRIDDTEDHQAVITWAELTQVSSPNSSDEEGGSTTAGWL